MYLGIDLGTSAVKSVVMAPSGEVIDESQVPLAISRPGPLMSEQNPEDWWQAVNASVLALKRYSSAVAGIGLSGQMHGAVLLDKDAEPLRPAILWNDGRSFAECKVLENTVDVPTLTGNRAMPGFTAPKLLWIQQHELETFSAIDCVLLPKDFIRLRMTGELATDMSDASGTLWLNVQARDWDDNMLTASSLERSHMPALFEGSDVTGVLTQKVASEWGMRRVPVVGGAGDQAAGAIGAGAIDPGICTLSLGTSGVIFAPSSTYNPKPQDGVHTFCHALPNTWHGMSVILSAAGSLSWLAEILNVPTVGDLLTEVEAFNASTQDILFLPYLSGERTPHNNPNATGVFIGLTTGSSRTHLTRAVLEGVAFALKDGCIALEHNAVRLDSLNVIGGGTQSLYWNQLIADVLNRPLILREDAAIGPALGAARLAQLAVEGSAVSAVCTQAPVQRVLEPNEDHTSAFEEKFVLFRQLYGDLIDYF